MSLRPLPDKSLSILLPDWDSWLYQCRTGRCSGGLSNQAERHDTIIQGGWDAYVAHHAVVHPEYNAPERTPA